MKGLFAGLTTIDIQYFTELFPGSDEKLTCDDPLIIPGGPATNAAVAFARLSGSATLFSAVGESPFRAFVMDDLRKSGVNHEDMLEGQSGFPVLAAVITSGHQGHRAVVSHSPRKICADINYDNLLRRIHPGILLTDGFYPEVVVPLCYIARKAGIPVVLDAGRWKQQFEQLLPLADVVICSESFHPPDCSSPDETLQFLSSGGVHRAAVTRGSQSIMYREGLLTGFLDIPQITVVDTLGAGDIFHGAFCFYYLKNRDFSGSLRNASQIAGHFCQFRGTRSWLNNPKTDLIIGKIS